MIRSLVFFALCTNGVIAFAPRSTTSFAAKSKALNLSDGASEALSLKPEETALVFIEYQNEFTTQGGALYDAVKDCMEKTGTIENSKKVMNAARSAGCQIIHAPIMFDEGHKEISPNAFGILAGVKEGQLFKSNQWGSDFCEGMKPAEGDIVVQGKRGLCGFASTNLDFTLRQNNIKNVVLGGFLTNCCVESTMRSAYELGYNVYTMKDCCAATSMEGQEAAYEHTFGMFSVPTTSDNIVAAVTK